MRLLPCKILNNMIIQLGEDGDCVNITLHKTLRIPDDGKTYPLPPSMGLFPIHKVDDYSDKVPKDWLKTGGVFFCMYQSEAMWLQFSQVGHKPKALKVGTGKVNAINGKEWSNELMKDDSDYCIIPEQKWLDGIASGRATIKQFVAEPLGSGMTVEGQVTGKEEFGGIQLLAYNTKLDYEPRRKEKKKKKPPIYTPPFDPPFIPHPQPPYPPVNQPHYPPVVCMGGMGGMPVKQAMQMQPQYHDVPSSASSNSYRMRSVESKIVCECEDDDTSFDGESGAKEIGLAAGGTVKQKVYEDCYGFETWDQNKFGRVFVHIVNSEMYEQITGEKAPKSDITASVYTQQGYPWFDVYDESKKGIGGSQILKNVKSVKTIKDEKNIWPKEDNETVNITNVITIGENNKDPDVVRDGTW